MDRLESMSTLVAAVEGGSLSAAGRRLGMPLATVSRKVSDLEGHLKTRLLNRTGRQLTLTDAGRSYLAACKRILADIDEAERDATGEFRAPKGELVVTAPVVFGRIHVLPIVLEFLRTFPEIDVRMVLSDRVTNLLEDRVDVAIRIGELPDSSLVARNIGAVELVVCASPAYLARRGTPTRPEDLGHHDCITFDGVAAPDAWIFRGCKPTARVAIRSRLVVTTAEAAIDAAIAGLGITRVLSYQVARALSEGALTCVLGAFQSAAAPIHLVHTGQPLPPLKLRAFMDFATPRLKSRISATGG
jgi:DNA-binding transcriptional LysR family regulator